MGQTAQPSSLIPFVFEVLVTDELLLVELDHFFLVHAPCVQCSGTPYTLVDRHGVSTDSTHGAVVQ